MKKLFLSSRRFIKEHPRTDVIALLLGLAIFATIAAFHITQASLWFDEAFSAYLSHFNFWDIARFTLNDVHPPFYYWMLKIWTSAFGATEVAYRSLSILFGAAAIATAFFLSRKLFGRRVAWLALLFMSISPMLIRYGDEARMYTLSALIVMLATYALVKARETNQRSMWVVYGVLVALGMWTHYFTALAWLAHWIWWAIETWRMHPTRKGFLKKMFSGNWILAYGLAVVIFLPWLPFMAKQLGGVQGGGFWIGAVGAYTPTNFLSNYFYYLEHWQVLSWLALALFYIIVVAFLALPRAYRSLKKSEKSSFLLVTILTWAPVVLLFLASLPPLRSSFVERYLLPSYVALSVFLAVVLVVGTKKWKPVWRVLPVVVVVGMMTIGITDVYYYGNYNKNTNTHILTRETVQLAQQNSPAGTPIVASSPWIFYEAVPYSTPEHPVFFMDENTQYDYGSLDMLKYSDDHKIKDMVQFAKENPIIWYLGSTEDDDMTPYDSSWVKIKTVGAYDSINNNVRYKATKFRISAE